MTIVYLASAAQLVVKASSTELLAAGISKPNLISPHYTSVMPYLLNHGSTRSLHYSLSWRHICIVLESIMGLLAFFLGFPQGWSKFFFLLKVFESGACMFEQGKLVCECKVLFLTSTHNPLMYIIYLHLRADYLILSWVLSRSSLRVYKARKSKTKSILACVSCMEVGMIGGLCLYIVIILGSQ